MKTVRALSVFALAAAMLFACTPEANVIPVTGVTISETSRIVAVGDDFDLTATVLPEDASNKKVTWTATPSGVLDVTQGGRVSAKGPGAGSVIVSTADGGFTAVCNVSVKASKVDVESIVLVPAALDLEVGKSAVLKATVLPEDATDKSLRWESTDDNVATVNDYGIVKAVGPGACIVYAISSDGRVRAGCSITSKRESVAVESIILEPASVELEVGESVTVKATVLPEDATDKSLKWECADKGVAAVESSGRVTGRSVGKTTLIVVASNGIVKYCPVVVKKSSSSSSFFATNDYEQTWSQNVDGTYGTGFSATTTNGLFIGYYKHTATLNPPAPNSSHIRIYKNSVLCIKTVSGKKIKKIVIACVPDAYYCNDMTGLEGNSGATADKSALTITWTGSSSKVVLMANNGQVRMEKLSVETE